MGIFVLYILFYLSDIPKGIILVEINTNKALYLSVFFLNRIHFTILELAARGSGKAKTNKRCMRDR